MQEKQNYENMVLRTLYIPKEMDERLRQTAFEKRISKNELIRQIIDRDLQRIAAEKPKARRQAVPA